jgi:hypothetical protein
MVAKKKKQKVVDAIECPYCADPDFFDKILTPTPEDQIVTYSPGMVRHGSHWAKAPKQKKPKKIKPMRGAKIIMHDGIGSPFAIDLETVIFLTSPEIKRGKFYIRTITDKDMVRHYAGFKIESIGVETAKEPLSPRGPFMSVQHRQSEKRDIIFNATRITHKDSSLIIDIHWTPEHKRIVTLRGFSPLGVATTPEELTIINAALKFYRVEMRGGAKINRESLKAAFAKHGKDAPPKIVADELGVTVSALRKWRARAGFGNWKHVAQIVARDT